MSAFLADEVSRVDCFCCYLRHQRHRHTSQRQYRKAVAGPTRESSNNVSDVKKRLGKLSKNPELNPEVKSSGVLCSTDDYARKLKDKKRAERARDKKLQSHGRHQLCTIQEEDEAVERPAAVVSFDNVHICAHMYEKAISDRHGPYSELARRALQNCDFFNDDRTQQLIKMWEGQNYLAKGPSFVVKHYD
ncbi:hypothetical protein IF1G_03316 [Cordyceps javanica]|uniref:Uncharacterized protein n=1 Tax=Cordyceps javanica TaxID=43265 RepID=A0A545V776_9HYPO|nr:hypothetical protein IF1G_03316 [Cordyceps javanica]TQW09242.1 hypothetical protein IF2G_03673 [Cordyceps javanica]